MHSWFSPYLLKELLIWGYNAKIQRICNRRDKQSLLVKFWCEWRWAWRKKQRRMRRGEAKARDFPPCSWNIFIIVPVNSYYGKIIGILICIKVHVYIFPTTHTMFSLLSMEEKISLTSFPIFSPPTPHCRPCSASSDGRTPMLSPSFTAATPESRPSIACLPCHYKSNAPPLPCKKKINLRLLL